MHEQFQPYIDYKKLIEIQASQVSEYPKAVFNESKKNKKTSSYYQKQKVKTIGRRK